MIIALFLIALMVIIYAAPHMALAIEVFLSPNATQAITPDLWVYGLIILGAALAIFFLGRWSVQRNIRHIPMSPKVWDAMGG